VCVFVANEFDDDDEDDEEEEGTDPIDAEEVSRAEPSVTLGEHVAQHLRATHTITHMPSHMARSLKDERTFFSVADLSV
jgi:hypothetical protein